MTDDQQDPRLRRLIEDTVAGVEPGDRLAQIRQRTSTPSRRRWPVAGGAAVLAVAATLVAVAVVDRPGETTADRGADRPSISDPREPTPPSTDTEESAPPPPNGDSSGSPVAVYYVGDGPDGPEAPPAVLYRYFAPGAPLELLMSAPDDPDYRTLWPAGSLVATSDPEAGMVQVVVSADVRSRPPGMTAEEANLALQQVVYTLQAYGRERVSVQFRDKRGALLDRVLGVSTAEPLANAPQLDVLSHMSISDPAEGAAYSGGFTARGVSNGFEASVYCRLVAEDGAVAWDAPTIAENWMGERLFPWEVEVDLAGVGPGDYTFSCQTDDPAGSAEGRGTDLDTRSIVVE